ncbi:hypothetical protein IVB55_05025 [Bradyrhizobium sp. CW4]|nr:hypothetical protein [Bradyrhizobium sp. CW4]
MSSKHRPVSVKKLAIGLPAHDWHKIAWPEGTAERLSSRFAGVRVRPAHRDYWLAESRPEEWLLIEWPEGEEAPTKYWFQRFRPTLDFVSSSIPPSCAGVLSAITNDLKQELGLGHFEGAWLSLSRNTVHRCLRIPGLGARNDFPLRNSLHQNLQGSYHSGKLSAEGIRHCGLSGTFQIRLGPSEEDCVRLSSPHYLDALVASGNIKSKGTHATKAARLTHARGGRVGYDGAA